MKRIKRQRKLKHLLELGYLYVYLFSYLDITVERQGDRFLSIQEAKQAVEQFQLRRHSRISGKKRHRGLEKKVRSLLP